MNMRNKTSDFIYSFYFFQTNAVRGIIAAVCCAAFFAILGLLHKFRWRPPTEDEMTASYKRKSSEVTLEKKGQDNKALDPE